MKKENSFENLPYTTKLFWKLVEEVRKEDGKN